MDKITGYPEPNYIELLAKMRSAAYNIPLDEAFRQVQQIERDKLADEEE